MPAGTYEARITTAEGTFLDQGTTAVHVDRYDTDLGFPSTTFSETFQSSLAAAIRIPASAVECKNGGWRTFTELRFKSQGDCIMYAR